MKKSWLRPAFALAAGAVGFGLRKWQLVTGFEWGTGLAVPGAPATLALLGWSAVVLAVLILLCRRTERAPTALEEAFDAEGHALFLTAGVLAAFLLLIAAAADGVSWSAAGGLRAGDVSRKGLQYAAAFLPPLRIVLGVLGFPCTLLWVRSLYRREGEKTRESLPLLCLCLLFCVWLISDYKVRAADPVTMNYLYELFAIISGLMGLYYITGWSFENGKFCHTAVMCLLAVYFALVTLADRHSLADLMRYGFVVLFMSAHAALLLNPPYRGERIATEKPETEETTHE